MDGADIGPVATAESAIEDGYARRSAMDPFFFIGTLLSLTEHFVANQDVVIEQGDRPLFIIEHFDTGHEIAILPPWMNLPAEIGDSSLWLWEQFDLQDQKHVDVIITLWRLLRYPNHYNCEWDYDTFAGDPTHVHPVWRIEVEDHCLLRGAAELMAIYNDAPSISEGSD